MHQDDMQIEEAFHFLKKKKDIEKIKWKKISQNWCTWPARLEGLICIMNFKNTHTRDFPGGPVVKNLPFNARRHGFDLLSGKMPRAVERPSLWGTTAEPPL